MTASLTPSTGSIPEFDMADRLKKTLSHSGVSTGEMADYLDVTRETVSRWSNGKHIPRAYLRLWALRTGVPLEWIETGACPPPEPSRVVHSTDKAAHGSQTGRRLGHDLVHDSAAASVF